MNIMKYILFTVGALAVLIAALCIFLYNRRLDKIAKGEARGTHTSVPEPKFVFVVVYLTFMFMMLCGTMIISQRTNVQTENYVDDIMDLKSEIEDLRHELAENSTHFRNISYETGNPDFKEKKMDIIYTAELKEYSENTKVTVNVDGTDVPLSKTSSGIYSGSFRTDMFKNVNQATVKITDDGRTVTEVVSEFEGDMFESLVPYISTSYQNASTLISFGKLSFEGGYIPVAEHPEDIESVTVTYMAGNTDIKTIDITEDVLNENTVLCDRITTEEDAIRFRYEITTKSGLKLVDTQDVCFRDHPGYPDDYKVLYDPDGNVLFSRGYVKVE